MVVSQPVVEHLALATILYQRQLAEQAQLVADRGFARLEQARQVTDAHLPPGQRPEDTQPVGLAHGLEQAGQGLGFPVRQGGRTGLGDAVRVDAADLAAVLVVSGGHGRLLLFYI